MLSSTALRPAAASVTPPVTGASTSLSVPPGRRAAVAVARAVRNYDSIPKREPFSSSRSVLDQFLRQEKPLVQRTKDQITGTLPPLLCSASAFISSRCAIGVLFSDFF